MVNRRRTDLAPPRVDVRAFRPRRVEVDGSAACAALAGWDYADAFECPWHLESGDDAFTVARAMLGPSRSARRVLVVRDLLVRPFGLREAQQGVELLFPVLEEEPDQVVCGLDDRHLDFRVIVTVSAGTARCTTVVRRHGALGTAYFAVVAPLHRRLVPRLLQRSQSRRRLDDGSGSCTSS